MHVIFDTSDCYWLTSCAQNSLAYHGIKLALPSWIYQPETIFHTKYKHQIY